MNYYPYKEAAYIASNAIFDTNEIIEAGGVIDYHENQLNGGGLELNRFNRTQSRKGGR